MIDRSARSSLAFAAITALAIGCEKPADVELATVRSGDLVIGVEVTGELEAVDSTPVRPPGLPQVWNYKIAFLVPEGTEVKKGDRLVGFDTAEQMRQLEAMKNQAESAATEISRQSSTAKMARQNEVLGLAESEAAVKKLELQVDQPRDLVAVSTLEATRIDRDIAVLRANHQRARVDLAKRSDAATLAGYRDKLEYAKGRIAQLQANLARMVVVAERPGTVIHPTSGRGSDKPKVGDSVWRMRTVLEVVSLDRMRGSGTVDEVDSARVKPGRPFTLRVDAHPDTELTGKVSEIGDGFVPKSRANPSKVDNVELDVADDRGLPLRPGMRFRGEIEVDRIANTISVPIAAVFVGADGPIVYRKKGRGFEVVRVEVGARSRTEIEIKSGLGEGDKVALEIPGAP